ncbi:MAG: hypothetical protein AAGF31_03390 [Planctomycetota bacterium]
MRSVHHRAKSVFLVGLSLAFVCPAFALDGNDVVASLKNLGASCEEDAGGNLVAVDFGFQPLATGDDLALLNGLHTVVDVAISEMNLSSDGFKHLASLAKLKRLDVSGTKCTDADIRHLAGLKSLEELVLSDSAVTDASIPTLVKLPNLRWIDLSSTRVTPAGLRRLRRAQPDLHVNEWWNYFVGYVGGRGVLDMDRATIVFESIQARNSAGGGGGGSIQISKSAKDDEDFTASGGGGVNGHLISASVSRINGIPTIQVGQHRIKIKGEGTELVVDDQAFPIDREKLRIVVDDDGVAALCN